MKSKMIFPPFGQDFLDRVGWNQKINKHSMKEWGMGRRDKARVWIREDGSAYIKANSIEINVHSIKLHFYDEAYIYSELILEGIQG